MSKVDFDNTKLQDLLKLLKVQQLGIRVGILGSSKERKETEIKTSKKGNERHKKTAVTSSVTNAEIGAKHEYGLDGMPVRSFLRVPLTEHLMQYIEQAGGFTPESFERIIAEKSMKEWNKIVAIIAETVVADAFDTSGFGQWEASNMERKKVKMTLIETNQLRESITSEVK